MKDCKTCIWYGKEKPGQCGNYLCRNQSEYDPRKGVEEADPGGESEGKAVNDYIKRFNNFAAEMNIPSKDKMTLLAMITEIGYTHERLLSDFHDCRNELCLKCGGYKQRHLGACDGCRWRSE